MLAARSSEDVLTWYLEWIIAQRERLAGTWPNGMEREETGARADKSEKCAIMEQ